MKSWFIEDTDQTWRDLAREDPYFAVLTLDTARGAAKDPARKAAFMQTGEEFVALVFAEWPELQATPRGTAVDFGCGVGRLLLPLARRFEKAIGVDVSDDMLAEARANAAEASLANLDFVKRIGDAPEADFVHSQIVLQHIPVNRGLALIASMWSRVNPGGLLAIQFPIAASLSIKGRLYKSIVQFAPWMRFVVNLLTGKRLSANRMQMNVYSLNDIVRLLHASGANQIGIVDWPSDPWHHGVYLLARRARPG